MSRGQGTPPKLLLIYGTSACTPVLLTPYRGKCLLTNRAKYVVQYNAAADVQHSGQWLNGSAAESSLCVASTFRACEDLLCAEQVLGSVRADQNALCHLKKKKKMQRWQSESESAHFGGKKIKNRKRLTLFLEMWC